MGLSLKRMAQATARRDDYKEWQQQLPMVVNPKPAQVAAAGKVVAAVASNNLLESVIRIAGNGHICGRLEGSYRCKLGESASISIKYTQAGPTMGHYAGCMNLDTEQIKAVRRHAYGAVVDPYAAYKRAAEKEMKGINLERVGMMRVLTRSSLLVSSIAAETNGNSIERGKEKEIWTKLCDTAEKFFTHICFVQHILIASRYKQEVVAYQSNLMQKLVEEKVGVWVATQRLMTDAVYEYTNRMDELKVVWKDSYRVNQQLGDATNAITQNIRDKLHAYGVRHITDECEEGISAFEKWLKSANSWEIINSPPDNNAAYEFRDCKFPPQIYLAAGPC